MKFNKNIFFCVVIMFVFGCNRGVDKEMLFGEWELYEVNIEYDINPNIKEQGFRKLYGAKYYFLDSNVFIFSMDTINKIAQWEYLNNTITIKDLSNRIVYKYQINSINNKELELIKYIDSDEYIKEKFKKIRFVK